MPGPFETRNSTNTQSEIFLIDFLSDTEVLYHGLRSLFQNNNQTFGPLEPDAVPRALFKS